MTPELYSRVARVLTVFSGRTIPDTASAPAEVLAAMGYDAATMIAQRQAWDLTSGQSPPLLPDGQPLVGTGNSGTYSIESRARLREGRTAVLRVTLRPGGNGVPGSAWTPLQWEEGTSPR